MTTIIASDSDFTPEFPEPKSKSRMLKDCRCPMERCRSCHSPRIEVVADFGDHYYISQFLAEGEDPGERWPLMLQYCADCTLVQLSHTAPQELMCRKHYWYRSGMNETMRAQLLDVIDGTMHQRDEFFFEDAGERGRTWLDIGANDGTLLNEVHYLFTRVAVEPADNLQDDLELGSSDYIIHDFWNSKVYTALDICPADVITAISMFYHLPDPNQFIADVAEVLADDGIFVAQLMCLKQMIETNDLGNVCHEHLEYYSYRSLVALYERHGLEIFKVEENDVNGGSYRLFARHYRSGSVQLDEPEIGPAEIRAWHGRIQDNREHCLAFIEMQREQSKKVYVYGASTKGNTILQYYGLDDNIISGAGDRNPSKHGRLCVGSNIPIVSEDEARANADFFLVLPHAFLDEFLEREKEWREGGGRFLVVTPEFKVIG